jgi:hypothetical protein
MREQLLGRGTYTIAGSSISASMPIFSASRANSTARSVVSSETPATSGTRPPTTSTPARSARRFSSGSNELFSPTVPSSTSPSMPSATSAASVIWHAGMSTARSAENCVVAAG